MYMNKSYKKIKKLIDNHRVINSSTGAVVEDDGINVDIAIVTGTLVANVDAVDKNDDDESGIDELDDDDGKSFVLLIILRKESCISFRNCVIFCVKCSLLTCVNVRSIPVINLSNAVDKTACLVCV